MAKWPKTLAIRLKTKHSPWARVQFRAGSLYKDLKCQGAGVVLLQQYTFWGLVEDTLTITPLNFFINQVNQLFQ